jgi:hypothetical protein
MVSADLSEHFEDLGCEFSGRGNDEGTETVVFSPLCAVELLEDGDNESQSLSTSCLGSS